MFMVHVERSGTVLHFFFVGFSAQSPLPNSCLEYGGLQCSHIFIIRCVFYCFHSWFIFVYVHLFSFFSFFFMSCFFSLEKTVTNLNHLHADPRLSSADLNADAFTHRRVYVQLVHTSPDNMKIAILPQFLAIEPRFVRKDRAGQVEIAILHQFLAIEPHFVRKGCAGHVEIAILHQFLTIEPHFVRKGAPDDLQIAILPPSFWRSNLIRAKGCAGQVEIAILPQFLAIEPRFVRKGCVSCRLVGTAPAPAFRREIEKKERARRQEGKSARGQEGKRRRCSDVEKVHAVVARSTFRSQNVKNTRGSDHFWRFRCRFAWQAQGIVHLVKVSKT